MSNNKQNIIVFINNSKMLNLPLTKQTKAIRDRTNLKIRELGNKYYFMKSIFDKINIHRDDIYVFGKILEEEYKGIKVGLHLQGQMKRSKDALISWFAENFYQEINDPNSKILERLYNLQFNKLPLQFPISSQKCIQNQFMEPINNNQTQISIVSDKIINNDDPKDIPKFSVFNDLKFNQETDSFEIEEFKAEKKTTRESNFQYDKILNF